MLHHFRVYAAAGRKAYVFSDFQGADPAEERSLGMAIQKPFP